MTSDEKKNRERNCFKASLMMRWWQANNNKNNNNTNINVILEFISTTEIEIVSRCCQCDNQPTKRDYRRFEGTKTKTKPKYI